jgi:hypothetical protein
LVRHGAADLDRVLVLSQTLVDDLTKQVFVRPSQVFDFGYKLRANPMHAAQHERSTEALRWKWGLIEWHFAKWQGVAAAARARGGENRRSMEWSTQFPVGQV